ncbi:MAG: rhodanese-like domain-containing protein [Candidatus Omnitrophica bacterium]|nr:rhodanese-like domain-containing protein [Candidatus Omnitrophota bacterium]
MKVRLVNLEQLGAILATSCILGLAYNAANPIGIRWWETDPHGPSKRQAIHSSDPSRGQNKASNSVLPLAVLLVEKTNLPSLGLTNIAAAEASSYVAPTPASWAEIKPLHANGQVVLVDARPRSYFEAGHIPGAVSLPEPPAADEFAAFCKQYPTNAHVVIYCSSTSCSLSFKLANRLAKEGGYSFVQYITGGYLAWLREETLANLGGISTTGRGNLAVSAAREMPAQDNPPIMPPISAIPTGQKLEHAMPITWAQSRPLLAIGQAVLLDARSKDEYDLGHITGALSLPADSTSETIRQVLTNRNSASRLIVYCGAMGCPEAFQLATRLMREMEFPNAQFMLEGYAEWRRAQKTIPPPGSAGR